MQFDVPLPRELVECAQRPVLGGLTSDGDVAEYPELIAAPDGGGQRVEDGFVVCVDLRFEAPGSPPAVRDEGADRT